MQFIEKNRARPFFMFVAHEAVHLPFQTPDDTPENRKRVEDLARIIDAEICAGRFDYLTGAKGSQATSLCGRNAVQLTGGGSAPPDLREVAMRLQTVGEVTENRYLVRARVAGHELTVFAEIEHSFVFHDDLRVLDFAPIVIFDLSQN